MVQLWLVVLLSVLALELGIVLLYSISTSITSRIAITIASLILIMIVIMSSTYSCGRENQSPRCDDASQAGILEATPCLNPKPIRLLQGLL